MQSNNLSTHEEVRQLVARFSDAANRADYDLFRSVWTEDCSWEFKSPMQMKVQGADAVTAKLEQLLGQWEFFVHLVLDGTISVAGDRGQARWYIREMARSSDHTRYYQNIGLYQDELVRQHGMWRFASRTYHYLWLDQNAFTGDVFAIDKSLPLLSGDSRRGA